MLDAFRIGSYAPAGIGRRSPLLPQDHPAAAMRLGAVSAQSHLGAELKVVTREGDVVTLDWSRDVQVTYARAGVAVDRDGDGRADAIASASRFERSVRTAFSFEVQGDLNEQELEDLRRVLLAVRHALREFGRGDAADAAEELATVRTSGSLASLQADFERSRSLQRVGAWVETAPAVPAEPPALPAPSHEDV